MNRVRSTKLINAHPRGFSLIELLVAMAVFVIIVTGIMFVSIDSLQATRRAGEQTQAAYLTQEAVEASMSIRNQGWKFLSLGTHGLSTASGVWQFAGTSESIDKYTRTVTVSAVQRNGSGNIVDSGGTVDPDTKKITVATQWPWSPSRTPALTAEAFLTNWRSDAWVQTTQAEFDAGTKTDTVSTNVAGGELTLAQGTGAEIGSEFVLDTTSSIGSMTSNQRWSSMRFTAQHSKSVTELRVYLQNENGVSPTYRYGLQTDVAGLPSGMWLGATNQGYGDHQATATGWRTIPLNEQVTLTAGTTYHLVVRWQSGTINGSRYVGLRNSNPQTQHIPFDNAADLAANTLFSTNSGGTWTTQNAQPLYLLRFDDNTYEGNPWIAKTDIRISGANFIGEIFTPSMDMTVTGVRFSVRKSGTATPGADLTASITQVGGGILTTGALVARTSVTTSYAWYTLSFSSPVNLTAGTSYRLYLSSPGTNNPYYQVRRLTTTNSAEYRGATFDGETAVYTSSANSGSSWTTSALTDIGGFVINTQGGYVLSGEYVSQPFDTGSSAPLYNYLAWDASLPTGTLEFQLRTANTLVALSTAAWVGPDGTASTRYASSPQEIITDPSASGTQFVQWKAYMTGDGATTPILQSVVINYEP